MAFLLSVIGVSQARAQGEAFSEDFEKWNKTQGWNVRPVDLPGWEVDVTVSKGPKDKQLFGALKFYEGAIYQYSQNNESVYFVTPKLYVSGEDDALTINAHCLGGSSVAKIVVSYSADHISWTELQYLHYTEMVTSGWQSHSFSGIPEGNWYVKFEICDASIDDITGFHYSTEPKTVYLAPNDDWLSDGARFALYMYNESQGEWTDFEKLPDEESPIYQAVVPAEYFSVVACRMNGNTTENSFNDGVKYNQTSDIYNVYDNALYTITGWDNASTVGLYTPVVETTKTLYLRPTSHWDIEGVEERYAVYMWKSDDGGVTDGWADFTAVEGEDGKYETTISDDFTSIVLVRMDGATTENNWDNKWNQTEDITGENFYDGACYTITSIDGGADGKSTYTLNDDQNPVTDIQGITTSHPSPLTSHPSILYDLQGRRMGNAKSRGFFDERSGRAERQIPSNVYIQDGRKVVIR